MQNGLKIGDKIIHKGYEFVIVDIRCDEDMDGSQLYIRAFDPSRADMEQQKKMKVDQTANNFIDMFRKLSEGGMGGFGIGGG